MILFTILEIKYIKYCMRKMKLKHNIKRRKLKLSNKVILVIIFLFVGIVLSLKIFNEKIKPVFLNIAQSESKKIATLIINDAISKQLTSDLTFENLFNMTTDNYGNITSIDFNSVIVNKILTLTTSTAILNLKYVEEGKTELLELPDSVIIDYEDDKLKKGIIYEIPSGVVFGNTILANVGPKIPVKISLIGDATSSINTKITNYGINNALIEVYVDLEVDIKVIMPLMSDTITVKTSIPVAIKLVQGNIPEYYSNSLSSPSLSVPIE